MCLLLVWLMNAQCVSSGYHYASYIIEISAQALKRIISIIYYMGTNDCFKATTIASLNTEHKHCHNKSYRTLLEEDCKI